MPAVSRSIEIHATPEQCYDVVWDFARYPEYLDEIKDATVHRDDGETAEATFKAVVVKKIEYTLSFTGDRPNGFSWVQTKGFFKKNDGAWAFKDLGDGRTEATYTLDTELPGLVPKSIVAKLTEVNFPRMLRVFKERIESVAG